MEISITSETVSQNSISGEVQEPIKDKIPERAKRFLRCITKIRSKPKIREEQLFVVSMNYTPH